MKKLDAMYRNITAISAITFCFLALSALDARAQIVTTYEVQAVYQQGGCMDIENGSFSSGENAKIQSCNDSDSQRWEFHPTTNGYYLVKAKHTGMCLDVKGASTRSGRNVQQYACHGGTNQQWRPESVDPMNPANKTFRLRNRNSSYCLAAVLPGNPIKQAHILEQNSCATAWSNNRWVLEDSFCGDNYCGFFENCSNCSADCGPCSTVCGNGLCESGESCSTCSSDCGTCPAVCGDSLCEFGETCYLCPTDCGSCPTVCGNSLCEFGEDCFSCPLDCALCPPEE